LHRHKPDVRKLRNSLGRNRPAESV
jgi:hypothetical protein